MSDENSEEFQSFSIDAEKRQELLAFLRDMDGLKSQAESIAETVREGVKAQAEKLGIPKKYLTRLVGAFHTSTAQKQTQEDDEFAALVETVLDSSK